MKKIKKTAYNDYATWIKFEVMANYCVRLILSDDLMKSARGRLGSQPSETNGGGFVFNVKGEGCSYIFLKLDADESTVAHECWHIVHAIMEWCGVEHFDNEFIAYHIDHMVEMVYKFKKAIQSSTKKEVSK